MKLAFESVDSVKDLNRKKGEGRKRNLMLFFCLTTGAGTSYFIFSCPQTGFISLAPLLPGPLDLN